VSVPRYTALRRNRRRHGAGSRSVLLQLDLCWRIGHTSSHYKSGVLIIGLCGGGTKSDGAEYPSVIESRLKPDTYFENESE
jgi:hypothetical protein